jgi:2-oxoglutarate dehydrogenase E2 component (dihydrolipoamide succinyltransferase)
MQAYAPSAPASLPPRTPAPNGLEEVVAMSPLRKRIAERLVQAQHTAAILTTFNEVDMSAVMALRAKHQDAFVAQHGIKLGFMSFFVKAAIESLKHWPGLNAEMYGTEVVYKKFYDIGVAVGGGKGLVVPVLRGADKMGFGDIEKGIAALAKKAQESKLTLEELSGGTFTISNGGIYGSMMSTPLLNMPQTGILGLHNIVKRAVVVSDKAGDRVEIRPMMYLALSYDHRVVDGREAVSFLVGVKDRIEQPDKLLFGL